MTDITDLTISGGGLAVVATDEMLADVEALTAISAGLEFVRVQLAVADATFSEQSRRLTQVAWARSAMDDAWLAMTEAKDVSDYVGAQLVTAIDNYTETERNVQWMAAAVDSLLAFLLGKTVATYADLLGPAGQILAAVFPWIVKAKFDGQDEAIGARDVTIAPWLNSISVNAEAVATLRNLVMNGSAFADGLGEPAMAVSEWLQSKGLSDAALSGGLLMMYAAQAGMLTETDVTVTKTATYTRDGAAVSSTLERAGAIPDPAIRADGAQIRIDEIHDGDSVRYEVFIAGTRDFNPISKGEPFDLASNVAGVSGQSPASYRAVELAMEQAGITSETPISISGYSQGALIASMLAASGDYNTQGLTTIGGPSGQVIIPAGVPALLIEHYEDMIPALGGAQANTDALVVRRHAFSETQTANLSEPIPGHQLEQYLETAELIDDAESSVLQSTVEKLNEFSDGDQVITTWYAAERVN